MAKSYVGEVIADSSGQWTRNQTRFATEAEANAAVSNLMMRWTLVTDTRVVETEDPVNCRWDRERGTVFLETEG